MSEEEGHLRLRDTVTGEALLRIDEVQVAYREAEERADKAEERADKAEERADEAEERADKEAAARRALEEELARLKREMAGRHENF